MTLFEKMPASIPSKEYPGEDAYLQVRKESPSLYFAWYTVIGETHSDYGAHAKSLDKALHILMEKAFGGMNA